MQHVPATAARGSYRSDSRVTIDLLELCWRRRVYIIVCAVIGMVAGLLYCALATPKYESTADILVVQKRPQAVTGDPQFESGFEDYLATHLAIISSPLIVERAIETHDLGSLACFADVEDSIEILSGVIIQDLYVEGGSQDLGDSANSIMTVSYRCSVPEDSAVVVQAVLDSYESFHHEVYEGMSEGTVDLIRQARDLLKNDLAQQEASYSVFRQQSPLVAKGTDEVNPLQDRLTTIEQQRSELLLRRAEFERQLLALEKAKEDGSSHDQLLAIVTELRQLATTETGLPDLSTTLESQLIQLVDDEHRLLEHYGPNHPHVAMIRERIAATRRFFALPTAAHMQEPASGETSQTTSEISDPVAVYTQYLRQELQRLEISAALLTELYDREHEAAKEHSIFQLKDKSYQRNIERTEELYDVVISRLQEASLIKDFGGFETRVIAPPRIGNKVSPRLTIILPAATLLGMVLGCSLAGVVELFDRSFQSMDQVQQQLRLPVVGQIPQFAGTEAASPGSVIDPSCDPMLCSWYEPRSSSAESFRALRTALYFSGLRSTTRVTQVAGPSLEEGASTVVANLAVSLAQTGKRVLLIDADLSRQRQLEMFGIDPPQSGLAAILSREVEPSEAVCQTAVENLWLLAAGPLPAGPHELFAGPRFGELINLVRESYDCVLIDTEPILTASDARVIASYSDAVVLTVRPSRDSRVRAKRAKAVLEQMDVRIVGVVINRMTGHLLRPHPGVNPDWGVSTDDGQHQSDYPAAGRHR